MACDGDKWIKTAALASSKEAGYELKVHWIVCHLEEMLSSLGGLWSAETITHAL